LGIFKNILGIKKLIISPISKKLKKQTYTHYEFKNLDLDSYIKGLFVFYINEETLTLLSILELSIKLNLSLTQGISFNLGFIEI